MQVKNIIIIFMIVLKQTYQDDDEQIQLPPKICTRDIVESYGLDSYLEPRQTDMYLCPKLEISCCSIYEQFAMFNNWQKRIKNKTEEYYSQINGTLFQLKDIIKSLMKINVKRMIEDKQIKDDLKTKLIEKFMFAYDADVPDLLDKAAVLQVDSSKYLTKQRAGFYCNICEFKNQQFIDIKESKITININSCGRLAKDTVIYSAFLYNQLFPILVDLSMIVKNLEILPRKTDIIVDEYVKINKDVTRCLYVVKDNSINYSGCKNFCNYFKFNAHSPVLEGDVNFLNKIIVQFARFVKDFSESRILQEKVKNTNGDKTMSMNLGTHKGFYSTIKEDNRILEGDSAGDDLALQFTRDEIDSLKDPYKEEKSHKKLDDYSLSNMYNFQKVYDEEKQNGYLNFMKNKLHYLDIAYDFEKSETEPILKTKDHIIIDLENYETVVADIGIDITQNNQNNFNSTMMDLMSHIKKTSKFKIYFEKLDKKLVHEINQIDDEYLKDFHRDNFLDYDDLSIDYKKNEIYNNVEKFQNQEGYNINLNLNI